MDSKIRIVLASHGEQSKGMLNTAQMLLGPQENIAAYCLLPEEEASVLTKKLEKEIETYGAENILFLTELMYGSPFNCVVSLTRETELNHITGVNQLMLMTALLNRTMEGKTMDTLCAEIIEAGKQGIADVKQLMAQRMEEEE